MPYVSPEYQRSAFNCPFCDAYSRMNWFQLYLRGSRGMETVSADLAICSHCHGQSFWLHERAPGSDEVVGRMLYPESATAPMPHPDMPDTVRVDYDEARRVSVASPRAAAALLRLAVQRLFICLGLPGKNLNDDIASLVRSGLPIEIQQTLDIVRVVGNNAVHPGELAESDVASISNALFNLVNAIVEDRISRPKKLRELFEALPQGARDAIQRRDS